MKIGLPKRKFPLPTIHFGYVSFREGTHLENCAMIHLTYGSYMILDLHTQRHFLLGLVAWNLCKNSNPQHSTRKTQHKFLPFIIKTSTLHNFREFLLQLPTSNFPSLQILGHFATTLHSTPRPLIQSIRPNVFTFSEAKSKPKASDSWRIPMGRLSQAAPRCPNETFVYVEKSANLWMCRWSLVEDF